MNPVPKVSSRQGITLPQEAREKSKETGTTEKVPEGMAGGHSVSPAADSNAFSIAFAGQSAGVTEPAGHTLQCRETAPKATSEAASTIPVDRTDPAQARLQHKSDIINKPGESGDQTQTEIMRSIMYKTMDEAVQLARQEGKLEEAKRKLEPVSLYITESMDEQVTRDLCRITALMLFDNGDIFSALAFFYQSRNHGNTITCFPEKLLVQQLTLARGAGSVKDGEFDPEFFYKEIQRWWLSIDKAKEKKLEQIIENSFNENASQVKIFRDGIKAIFDDEDILVGEKFEHIIAELSKPWEGQSKPKPWILDHLPDMLKFARNLRLIEKGYLQEALEKVTSDSEDYEFQYLNKYIHCQVLKESGNIDQAIEMCKQGLEKGYPFSGCLIRLSAEKTIAEYDAREYEPACGIPA